MREKLSLEQFQKIKAALDNLVVQTEQLYEKHKGDSNYDTDAEEMRFVEQYTVIQNQLLSYDLSDIPYEAWEGYYIASDEEHIADFSGTGANIDFELVDYYGCGNFKGCNVRNLDKLYRWLSPKSFDEQTISKNPSLFLSGNFSEDFSEKYYSCSLTISDIASLSREQLEEVKGKGLKSHINFIGESELMFDVLGPDKIVQLYNHSLEEYNAVRTFFDKHYSYRVGLDREESKVASFEELTDELKNTEVSQIKDKCFSYLRDIFENSRVTLRENSCPELFVKENPDIFLITANIPDEVRSRYFIKALRIQDLIDYPDVFQNISLDYFFDDNGSIVKYIREKYGKGKFQELVSKHPDVFSYLIKEWQIHSFKDFLEQKKSDNLEADFTLAIKDYISNIGITNNLVPEWLSSMNFQFVNKLHTNEDFKSYNDSVFVLDKDQRRVLDSLGFQNIKRFEEETGFFTHKIDEYPNDLEMISILSDFFRKYDNQSLAKLGINFRNGTLTYEEFLDEFAKCLDIMRKEDMFSSYSNYSWMDGDFRDNHPELFIDKNAPEELKKCFYKNRINADFLYKHKEYIPDLIDKNLSHTISLDMKLTVPGLSSGSEEVLPHSLNFIDEYTARYGNEKFLQLISKYGDVLSNITVSGINGEMDNEEDIESSLRNAIYNKLLERNYNYSYLAGVSELVSEHPDIFVDFNCLTEISEEERKRLTNAFYNGTLGFNDIQKYPQLIDILKDKNLQIAFSKKDGIHTNGRIILQDGNNRINNGNHSDLELLEVFGNEEFLKLCAKCGRYMDGMAQLLTEEFDIVNGKYVYKNNPENPLDIKDVSNKIKEIIIKKCLRGEFAYRPDDAPDFLRDNHPELFLGDDAPEELKYYFYNYGNNYPMTFIVLNKHKEWQPYLEGKSLTTSLLRNNSMRPEVSRYLLMFGEEKALKLGKNKAETVDEMLRSHNVELMKSWYDKTGGKFIPDFVVMQNFNVDEADKFLTSGANWSNLMKIKNFAKTAETRDALLKLAYSFGAFDQDARGFKKLKDLLTNLPMRISQENGHIIEKIDDEISDNCRDISFYETPNLDSETAYQMMLESAKNNKYSGIFDSTTLPVLLEALKKENVGIDFSKDIFKQIYRKNNDGTYTLAINPQRFPKSAQAIRSALEKFRDLPIVSPEKAHKFFGGFKLEYDADFREFFLKNYDVIISDSKYLSQISAIQRRFKEIKTVYSNVNLTLDLAMSYIDNNKYENVNVGNERVTQTAALQNYSQKDFEMLQRIFNYGKQRTFSSIPRIESESKIELPSGNYYYKMLRLDDPRAMSIGFESDCCQRLGEPAEICMEHSMVDKNGRVFIITNENGEVVAQSWVWRNKDVLCFDNIEIPDQKMWDNGVPRGKEDSGIRNEFTDDILYIYKMAAHRLIDEDEKVYRELLESGKITQEQYDGLRLGKITTGLGYSNIKGSLETLPIDKGPISRPLPFEEPVKLSRGLYTNDSNTQYILEERDDRKEFDGETLSVHNDDYIEFDDTNFTEKSLLTLEKLELVTKENPQYLDTSVGSSSHEHLVTAIARNYDLNPYTTKIVMNPNFAIIYDVNGDSLKIGDLLFNTRIQNEQQDMDIERQVAMQIGLALRQIASEKEIDISSLNAKQKEMYEKVIKLKDEMDEERGVGHAI